MPIVASPACQVVSPREAEEDPPVPVFENTQQCFTARCGEFLSGDPVEVCVPAGTFTSEVSQEDADAQALASAEAQATAALVCTPAYRTFAGGASLSKSQDQSLNANELTMLTWEEVLWDTDGLRSGDTIVIPAEFDGMYAQVFASARFHGSFGAGSSPWRGLEVRKNGELFQGSAGEKGGPSGQSGSAPKTVARSLVTPPVPVSSGDIFTVHATWGDNIPGSVLNHGQTWFTLVVFSSVAGALVKRDTRQGITTSGYHKAIWQSAVYDTNGFWSAENPTRLTVPAEVSRIRLYAGTEHETDLARWTRIIKNGTSELFVGGASQQNSMAGGSTVNCPHAIATPVLEVSPGDFFEVETGISSSDLLATEKSFFALEVVE